MKLNRVFALALALMVGCFAATASAAEDLEAQVKKLQQGQDELRTQLAQMNITLQAILQEIKKSGAGGDNEVDKKLTQILSQMNTLQRTVAAGNKPNQPKKRQPDNKIYDIAIGDSPYMGKKDAPVTIVEFSDLQCPFCVREVPKLKQIAKKYPDDVKVVFKHFPLRMHKKAPMIHAACEQAKIEKGNDGFWEMHDKILAADRKSISKDTLIQFAEEMSLNMDNFKALMADDTRITALANKDMAEGSKAGVRGTPTVLINGKKLSPRNLPDYEARIKEILDKKKANQ